MSLSSAQTLNMGRIGLICPIPVPFVHGRLDLFTTLILQEHRDLKSGLVTLHVARLDPQKFTKLGRIELGQCLGRTQAMYKMGLIMNKIWMTLCEFSQIPYLGLNTYFH